MRLWFRSSNMGHCAASSTPYKLEIKKMSSSQSCRAARAIDAAVRLTIFACLSADAASGSVPDWVRLATAESQPLHSPTVDAVVLLDERVALVGENGEARNIYRRVYRILRPEGRKLGYVVVPFDAETRVTGLK